MTIRGNMIQWGGKNSDSFYIAPLPNWLPKGYRHWGLKRYFYDQPHVAFGFWFFNVSWSLPSTPWTR